MKPLVIKNIEKMIGFETMGRAIEYVEVIDTDRNPAKNHSYVFHFPELVTKHKSGWEERFEIFLYREPNSDRKYELFVMGWHRNTVKLLDKSEINDIGVFKGHVDSVIKARYNQYLPF